MSRKDLKRWTCKIIMVLKDCLNQDFNKHPVATESDLLGPLSFQFCVMMKRLSITLGGEGQGEFLTCIPVDVIC